MRSSPDQIRQTAAPPPGGITREAALAERARRRAVRAGVLAGLPRPGGYVPPPSENLGAGSRPELWPPPPALPPRTPSRDGNTYTPDLLRELLREFAAARGADFGVVEFARWSGVCTATLYRHLGRWPAARASAGLPARARRPDRRRATLHALLETLHRNRGRTKPLTANQLAAACGVSAACVNGHGGIGALRALARDWAHAWDARDREARDAKPRDGRPSALRPGEG